MGYDVHLVRTTDWLDSESNPVTKEDINAALAGDPTLSWSDTDYVEMAEDNGSAERYFMINWQGDAVFWWYKSEVRCKNPNEEQLLKLVDLAAALGAHVVGDDGEKYQRGKTIFGKPKVVIQHE
jgi:hypothetical protein